MTPPGSESLPSSNLDKDEMARHLIECAQAAVARAAERATAIVRVTAQRKVQHSCGACGQRLDTTPGVLFQGDHLVHAACWPGDSKPVAGPPIG
jgi:hypothetical protein